MKVAGTGWILWVNMDVFVNMNVNLSLVLKEMSRVVLLVIQVWAIYYRVVFYLFFEVLFTLGCPFSTKTDRPWVPANTKIIKTF